MVVDSKHFKTATQRIKGTHLVCMQNMKIITNISQNTDMCTSSQSCEVLLSHLAAVAETKKVCFSFHSAIPQKWPPTRDNVS